MILIQDGDAELYINADGLAITLWSLLSPVAQQECIRRIVSARDKGLIGVRKITLSRIAPPNGAERHDRGH